MQKIVIVLIFSFLLFGCKSNDNNRIKSGAMQSNLTANNCLSNNQSDCASDFFTEEIINDYYTEFGKTIVDYNTFFGSQNLSGEDVYVLQENDSNLPLKFIKMWSFRGKNRTSIAIFRSSINPTDFYQGYSVEPIKYNDLDFYLLNGDKYQRYVAYYQDGYICEISFDRVAFHEDSLLPITLEAYKINDYYLEQAYSLFQESNLLCPDNYELLKKYV